MTIFGYKIAARLIAIVVGVIALLLVVGFTVRSCDKRRSQAAQSRVESAQSNAAHESAADAINTVQASGEAERASEDLTRQNDKEIRNAQGANERVGSGVDLAGRRSLCRRPAYRDDPKCRVFNAPAR